MLILVSWSTFLFSDEAIQYILVFTSDRTAISSESNVILTIWYYVNKQIQFLLLKIWFNLNANLNPFHTLDIEGLPLILYSRCSPEIFCFSGFFFFLSCFAFKTTYFCHFVEIWEDTHRVEGNQLYSTFPWVEQILSFHFSFFIIGDAL